MRLLTVLSLAFLLAGCDLIAKLQNNVILVATLVQSPQPPSGIGGSPVVIAQLYLAQKSGDLTTAPSEASLSPITGATVAVRDNGVQVATLGGIPSAPGYYESTSVTYNATHTYRFTATVGSDQYWAEVANVPAPPSVTLPGTPSSGIYTYTNYSNTAQFPDPYPITRTGTDIAFWGVWPVGASFDPNATPSCTNFPQTAGDFLTLVFVDDAPYRAPTFSVPKATCFPEPLPGNFPAKYVVALTAVKKGTTSSNTSIFSGALAGTSAAAGVFVTLP